MSFVISFSDPAAGVSDDWYKGVLKSRFAYCVELRDKGNYGFLLPPQQIKSTGEELWAAQRVVFQKMVDLSNDETTPTAQPPTTQHPSTQPPTTQPPTTQSPTTQPPTTQSPTTQPPSGCGSPQWANDMYCDDENNNPSCNYDGGACCSNSASGKKVQTDFKYDKLNSNQCSGSKISMDRLFL